MGASSAPRIRIESAPFDPAAELAAFETDAGRTAGAVVCFLGKVREGASDDPVRALYLEHYPGMTERAIEATAAEAQRRWSLFDCLVIHRVGAMAPGEPIVFVCASAAHRRDAFQAADRLMDYLKTKALFWKKEMRDNSEAWIEPRPADHADEARWKD